MRATSKRCRHQKMCDTYYNLAATCHEKKEGCSSIAQCISGHGRVAQSPHESTLDAWQQVVLGYGGVQL